MSTTHRMLGLAEAELAARKFRDLFAGTYARWEVAGSVRRRRSDVGDLEHVVIPLFADVPADDLFGAPTRTNLLLRRADELRAAGTIAQHLYPNGSPRWGEKYRGCDFACMGMISNHEIFCADESNWGATLAIRTGPAELSQALVMGLRRNGHRNKDGKVWRCRACPAWPGCTKVCHHCQGTGLEPVDEVSVPEERAYFALAGVAWREPAERR